LWSHEPPPQHSGCASCRSAPRVAHNFSSELQSARRRSSVAVSARLWQCTACSRHSLGVARKSTSSPSPGRSGSEDEAGLRRRQGCLLHPTSTSSNLIGTQLVNEVAGAHCLRKPSKKEISKLLPLPKLRPRHHSQVMDIGLQLHAWLSICFRREYLGDASNDCGLHPWRRGRQIA
jgi:hypothetical protein